MGQVSSLLKDFILFLFNELLKVLRIELFFFLSLLTFVSDFFGNPDNKVGQVFIFEVIVR